MRVIAQGMRFVQVIKPLELYPWVFPGGFVRFWVDLGDRKDDAFWNRC